jgi:hypothetical protein
LSRQSTQPTPGQIVVQGELRQSDIVTDGRVRQAEHRTRMAGTERL